MIETDRLMAERLQIREQEELIDEEKERLFVELLEKSRLHFVAFRSSNDTEQTAATRAQNRNTMSTYLKNITRYKHNQLKSKKLVKGSKTKAKGSSKRTRDELESDKSKKQKIDEHVEAEKDYDQEEAEMKKHIEIVKDDEKICITYPNVNNTNNINTVSLTVNAADIENNVTDENIVYGCDDEPNMPNLEEIVYSDDDDGVDAKADMTNLDTNIFLKRLLHNEVQMSLYGIKLTLFLGLQETQQLMDLYISGDLSHGNVRRTIVANSTTEAEYVAASSCCGQDTSDSNAMDFHQSRQVCGKLKKLSFSTVKTASTPMETSNPLLIDAEAKDVYPKDSLFDLEAYTNSDYAGASLDRKSTTGDETIINEWEDKMERDATTASSLEAEHDTRFCLENTNTSLKCSDCPEGLELRAGEKRKEDCIQTGEEIVDLDADIEVTLIDEIQGRNDEDLMFDWVFLIVMRRSRHLQITPIVSPLQLPQAKDKGKAKMVEPKKPLKKKDQIAIDEDVARNFEAQLQAELEEEDRLSRQMTEEANVSFIKSWDNTTSMKDADFQLGSQMQTEEQE
ncbi:hypothetical protein Tco_0389239 [Tanacetum coccineum]